MCGRQLTFSCLKKACHYTLLASVLAVSLLHANVGMNEHSVVTSLERTYGQRAGLRAKAWFNILRDAQSQPEMEKLTSVNNFFNLFHFVTDMKLWGTSNYWATPLEFIGANGGDCEDFSIAKYFTLLQLGVQDEKMRITMVKATSVNQYHMVLAYYETPGSIPLILDNLDPVIKPATARTDLLPVYSFNGKQLWLNKEKGRGVLAGSATRLEKWNDLQHRLGADRLRKPKLVME
ncbi:transglutaminase-like cysteine peptidase [Shewanella sp. YIC-542]|uniref:transglutaminase-like cysteine peptidase n=1 Tax=Shewanella mytili TaxID=3377111 RepID=UPI00398E76D2